MMKKVAISLILLFSVSLLSGCGGKNRVAFVYPYGVSSGEESWIIRDGFKSLEECRNFALDNDTGNEGFDYECGRGCEKKSGFHVCNETLQ